MGVTHREMPKPEGRVAIDDFQLLANLSKSHRMMYPRCLNAKGDRVKIPAPDGLAAWCGPIAMNTRGGP